MRKREDLIVLNARLPASLHQRLSYAAVQANRSLNAEFVWRLEHTFRMEDAALRRVASEVPPPRGTAAADILERLEGLERELRNLVHGANKRAEE